MLLEAKDLLAAKKAELVARRQKLSFPPGLGLIWIGDDRPTAAFIRAKQRQAQELDCQFFLHHLQAASSRQAEAVLQGLNQKKAVTGIVLQLPLPKALNPDRLIGQINPDKDIDGLRPSSRFPAPTPTGILALLKHHKINPAECSTVILGAGRLVGKPLAEVWQKNGWPYQQISHEAAKQTAAIRKHDILIAATGVNGLVSSAMVHREMVVVDGSGVDVEVAKIEPLVKAVTPKKGAIGPLTVCFLFANLLKAAERAVRG